MNFLFISPNYPTTYYKFCAALKNEGVSVCAIGDASYDGLCQELREAVTEYVQVWNLRNFDDVVNAARYLEGKHGKFLGIESNNEFWLEQDARLRASLNVEGVKPEGLEIYKYKSKMKVPFQKAKAATAPYIVTREKFDAVEFAILNGYPIFAKPDKGVGACGAQKIRDERELDEFFNTPLDVDYIFEVYVNGRLFSYDGLTDKQGNIVFEAAHFFTTPIDVLSESGEECVYRTLKRVPKSLAIAGRKTVEAFEVKGRFFHIEFFELKETTAFGKKGDFLGIEVNMRPAGGYTPEMLNAAKEIDIYTLWARCMKEDAVKKIKVSKKFYCVNVGRHERKDYAYSVDDLRKKFGKALIFAEASSAGDNPFGNFELIGKFRTNIKSRAFCKCACKVK